MSKEAWLVPEVKKKMVELALYKPHMSKEEIHKRLEDEFSGREISATIPKLSTIDRRVREFRREANENIQEQPWSLAVMAKSDTDIPWEAAGFLLWAFAELRHVKNRGETIWRWSEHPLDDFYKGGVEKVMESFGTDSEPEHVSVKPLAPRAPVGTIMTNRQAKWLARLHLMFPGLKPNDLFYHADAYTQQELLADYLGWDFDTSYLDESLSYRAKQIGERGYNPPNRGKQNEKGKEE